MSHAVQYHLLADKAKLELRLNDAGCLRRVLQIFVDFGHSFVPWAYSFVGQREVIAHHVNTVDIMFLCVLVNRHDSI